LKRFFLEAALNPFQQAADTWAQDVRHIPETTGETP
jgi:hypothetical protein